MPAQPTAPSNPWSLAPYAQEAAAMLAGQLGCPAAIAAVLAARGLTDAVAAHRFLHPSLDQLHDPMLLAGMAAAVQRIQRALRNAEPILIYGDYDVDGTTATALLKTALEMAAARLLPDQPQPPITFHVPHRIREGYGMQTGVLAQAAAAGVRLVISVDTGIRAYAAATEARALGLDLIVTDHHLPDDANGLPEALAVINPAQPGCPYPFKHLCGAAVAFKLAHALLLATCEDDVQRQRLLTRTLPSFLKLVAIATIADSVPLVDENRVIASLGLAGLANPVQPGLRALFQVAEIPASRPPTATEVGFRIAPRINAAGRMDVASEVVDLLLTRDEALAQRLARKLDELNTARRSTEQEALDEIEQQLQQLRDSATGEFPATCLVLDHPGWHRGVLGILASRVVERTGRPALVLCHEGEEAHGSGRSVPGYHLLDALTALDATAPLLTRFGGHAQAVGLSLPVASLPELRMRLLRHGLDLSAEGDLPDALEVAAELNPAEVTPELHHWLQQLGPFGMENPEPVFLLRNVTLAQPVRLIKQRHIALVLRLPGQPVALNAVGWSRGRLDWVARSQQLGLDAGTRIDLAVRIVAPGAYSAGRVEVEIAALWSADAIN
ncbi:MAG: single-stranded-DNA-specific exonuclease RecJ [Acidobacteriota bacterium]|nr:single-stranded-DNA-specific exonuclease RecJ [Acidobacteriota bacterium]